MVKNRRKPEEEPVNAQSEESAKAKAPSLYSGITDAISDADLENHEVSKVIAKTALSENKRLEREITDLKNYKDRYYDKKEESAVLGTQLSQQEESVGVRNLLYTVGGILGGLLFNDNMAPYRLALIVLSLICFIMAVKVKPRWPWNFFKKEEKI